MAVVDPRITEPIDRHRLQQILLGQITAWADGSPIVIVLASDPASRAAIEEVSGRDLDRLLRGWKRLIFTGSGAMPTVVDSPQEALNKVSSQSGAITLLGSAPSDPVTHPMRTINATK